MTFLHDEKIVPPDEAVDTETPACKACGAEMWLVSFSKQISDEGTQNSYSYECPKCGAFEKVRKSTPADPEPAAARKM